MSVATQPALNSAQRSALVDKIRRGANLPALVAHAKQAGWRVSRTTLAELLKHTRQQAQQAQAAPPGAPAAPQDPATALEALRGEVALLAARLTALETQGLPRLTLTEVSTQAVQVAVRKAQDPTLDPAIQVKWVAELPALMAEARRVREAEGEEGDDAPLFSA